MRFCLHPPRRRKLRGGSDSEGARVKRVDNGSYSSDDDNGLNTVSSSILSCIGFLFWRWF